MASTMLTICFALLMQFGPPWLPQAERLPPPRPAPANFQPIRTIVTSWCIALELLDPRETRYVFAHPADFNSDLEMIRKRAVELRDAPLLWESTRFPPREVCNELLAFNRTVRCHVEVCNTVYPRRENRETMRRLDEAYAAWDLARDGSCTYYYVTVRRQALKRLRELIGEQAFIRGELPSHVPF